MNNSVRKVNVEQYYWFAFSKRYYYSAYYTFYNKIGFALSDESGKES